MVDPAVTATSLTKVFRSRLSNGTSGFLAVDDVSFTVRRGGALAIVGESGSGKTTIARMLVGLETPSRGEIAIEGRDRSQRARSAAERRRRANEAQLIFQDPYSSLDPRQRVRDCVGEVVSLHGGVAGSARSRRVAELLAQVGLDDTQGASLPSRLSGGQRQRVAIARALAAEARVLVLDEAVAALDVSTQAQVINLLARLREETGIAYIFVSHDLALVRHITEDTLVLQHGRVVEYSSTETILTNPQQAYTRLLLESIPRPGWKPTRAKYVPPRAG